MSWRVVLKDGSSDPRYPHEIPPDKVSFLERKEDSKVFRISGPPDKVKSFFIRTTADQVRMGGKETRITGTKDLGLILKSSKETAILSLYPLRDAMILEVGIKKALSFLDRLLGRGTPKKLEDISYRKEVPLAGKEVRIVLRILVPSLDWAVEFQHSNSFRPDGL